MGRQKRTPRTGKKRGKWALLNEKRRAERTSELLDGPEAAEGDKLSQETLQALDASDTVKALLQNRHLRELVLEIDGSARPQRLLQRSMSIPVFEEFAEECLKLCGLKERQPKLAS